MNQLPPFVGLRRIARSAFTLIELLTVMVIIGVLVALLIPVVQHVRRQAESKQCITQLRQIGFAIGAYVLDQDGYLPGPLVSKQSACYSADTRGSLALLLEKYLAQWSLPVTNPQDPVQRFSPLFLCPAGSRVLGSQTSPTYIVNMLELPSYKQAPWGNLDRDESPLLQSALVAWTDAILNHDRPLDRAALWAVRDGDQEYFGESDFVYADPEGLPRQPAHGDHRHALFYDFHVARVDLIQVTRTETREGGGVAPEAPAAAP